MKKNQNNNGCGCDCHPQPVPVPLVDINMGVCDRNMNMLPMLQTYTTKVLKPNIESCCKKNILIQEMLSCENYKYVIKWDFDLNGKTITVPENCILEFDGGSLKNGTIVGQNTVFINVGDVEIWGEDLTRQGTWKEHSGGGGGHEDDRSYDPADFVGMGKKYLQKNVVGDKNILTQGMINEEHTIYVIQYDFDLDDEEVEIPSYCVLLFDGGSISNGTLVLNNTYIEGVGGVNCTLSGTIANTEVNVNILKDESDSLLLQGLFSTKPAKVIFNDREYSFDNVDIYDSIEICGNNTVIIPLKKEHSGYAEGLNMLKNVFRGYGFNNNTETNPHTGVGHPDVKSVVIHGFTFRSDVGTISTYGWSIDKTKPYSDPIIDIDYIDNLHIYNCKFDSIEGWADNNPKQLNEGWRDGILITARDVDNALIEKCETTNCRADEQIWVPVERKQREQIKFTFRNNYIHDQNPTSNSSALTTFCGKLYVENNIVERWVYAGSIFNLHGLYVNINNNIVRDSISGSVFDLCEWGYTYSESITAENNHIECTNAIVFALMTRYVTLKNNYISAYNFVYGLNCLLYDVVRRSDTYVYYTKEAALNTVCYENVDISGNYINCNNRNYQASIGFTVPGLSPIHIQPKIKNGNYINIVDNTIITPTSAELIAAGKSPCDPIFLWNCDNIRVQNNIINTAIKRHSDRNYIIQADSTYLIDDAGGYYTREEDKIKNGNVTIKSLSITDNTILNIEGSVLSFAEINLAIDAGLSPTIEEMNGFKVEECIIRDNNFPPKFSIADVKTFTPYLRGISYINKFIGDINANDKSSCIIHNEENIYETCERTELGRYKNEFYLGTEMYYKNGTCVELLRGPGNARAITEDTLVSKGQQVRLWFPNGLERVYKILNNGTLTISNYPWDTIERNPSTLPSTTSVCLWNNVYLFPIGYEQTPDTIGGTSIIISGRKLPYFAEATNKGLQVFDSVNNKPMWGINGGGWKDANGFTSTSNRGTTEERPVGKYIIRSGSALPQNIGTGLYVGYTFLNNTDGKYYIATEIDGNIITWTEENVFAEKQVPQDTPRTGTTTERPTAAYANENLYVGFEYYDTTYGYRIYISELSASNIVWKISPINYGLSPTSDIGFCYFDTTLGMSIYASAINNQTGEVLWTRADGKFLPSLTVSYTMQYGYYSEGLHKHIYYAPGGATKDITQDGVDYGKTYRIVSSDDSIPKDGYYFVQKQSDDTFVSQDSSINNTVKISAKRENTGYLNIVVYTDTQVDPFTIQLFDLD